jgi:general secretion pathway protein A
MYKAFFSLKRNPFELTPDPAFLFPTRRHNEALAALYYGIRRHKGFVVLTGEVGTGKTLLLRCLLKLMKKSTDISYAYLFNSLLSPTEFLQYVLADFGVQTSGKSKGELLFELSRFLISRGQQNLTTVLIVDEAHHLSDEILEEIRLLTNVETPEDKLLQIVLVGQPELDDKLDSNGLRQLKQRVAFRAHLEPLNLEETKGYIEQRLQIAGEDAQAKSIFPMEAIEAVHFYSSGFPRLINNICENALIAAYAKQVSCVSPQIIEDVAGELRIVPGGSCEHAQSNSQSEMDIEQVTNALLEMYSEDEQELAMREAIRAGKR